MLDVVAVSHDIMRVAANPCTGTASNINQINMVWKIERIGEEYTKQKNTAASDSVNPGRPTDSDAATPWRRLPTAGG